MLIILPMDSGIVDQICFPGDLVASAENNCKTEGTSTIIGLEVSLDGCIGSGNVKIKISGIGSYKWDDIATTVVTEGPIPEQGKKLHFPNLKFSGPPDFGMIGTVYNLPESAERYSFISY